MNPRRWNTVTDSKMIKFVNTNQGLTASMIALLWRRPYGTVSAVLHDLAKKGEISRTKGQGMRGGSVEAWRYYEAKPGLTAACAGIDELISKTQ